MFTNFSWSSYLLFVALLLIAWYLFVGVRYYFGELHALASGKFGCFRRMLSSEGQTATIDRSKNNITTSDRLTDEEAEMGMLSSRLTEAIAMAATRTFGREEFLFLLQHTLKEFPALKETQFQTEVAELIQTECENYGIDRLGADELQQLWIEAA